MFWMVVMRWLKTKHPCYRPDVIVARVIDRTDSELEISTNGEGSVEDEDEDGVSK